MIKDYCDILLGFDIRLSYNNYSDALWHKDRRNTHLLNPETKWPLSVDLMAWPSFFQYADYFYQPNLFNAEMINIVPNNPRQAGLRLWANLEEMKKIFLLKKNNEERHGIIIGIKLILENPLNPDDWWNAVTDPEVLPSRCPSNWKFLGYDIADRDMISGLSNCGYTEDEKPLLQKIWMNKLNEYGLLNKKEDAMQFKNLSEQRVPDHKPFFVYGLFRDTNPI